MVTGQKQDLPTDYFRVFKKVFKTIAKMTGSMEALKGNASA